MNLTDKKRSHILYPFFKRCFDILFSSCFIILFLPFYLLIILLIKLDSKGPVFYVGQRLGRGGTIIKTIKFRTMYVDAEQRLKELLTFNSKIREEWKLFQKLHKDPRCTWVGKFLRKTSLDELPQFFNVLKGDLSVVGPRPHYVCELQEKEDSPLKKYAHLILSVKPGITGIWQISGRNKLSYKDRVVLDSLYMKKQSFFYDLIIIVKTIPVILSSKGAF